MTLQHFSLMICGCCLFLFACSQEEEVVDRKLKLNDSTEIVLAPKPDKLLPKEQMVSLIVQLQIAESVVSQEGLLQLNAAARFRKYQYQILKNNQVDTTVFRQNYEYYMGDVKRAEWIYAAALDSLLLRKSRKNL